jgi:hypothetical protein
MGQNRKDVAEAVKKCERRVREVTPKWEAAKKAFEVLDEQKIDAERDLEGFKMALEDMDIQEGRL